MGSSGAASGCAYPPRTRLDAQAVQSGPEVPTTRRAAAARTPPRSARTVQPSVPTAWSRPTYGPRPRSAPSQHASSRNTARACANDRDANRVLVVPASRYPTTYPSGPTSSTTHSGPSGAPPRHREVGPDQQPVVEGVVAEVDELGRRVDRVPVDARSRQPPSRSGTRCVGHLHQDPEPAQVAHGQRDAGGCRGTGSRRRPPPAAPARRPPGGWPRRPGTGARPAARARPEHGPALVADPFEREVVVRGQGPDHRASVTRRQSVSPRRGRAPGR